MQAADATLRTIRRLLLGALIAGMAGTASELLLIGHFENSWQLVPLVLLVVGTFIALAHALSPHATTVRLLQFVMACFVLSGGIGMVRGRAPRALRDDQVIAFALPVSLIPSPYS